MGYDGKGVGKGIQGILSPIVAAQRAKHEGIGFNGRVENPMSSKTTFVNMNDILEFTY
jgi:hypothetical protein